MNFSVDLTTEKLEALLMTTRDEMLAGLTELSAKVVDEAAQSKAILASMAEVVTGLKDKVASLELAAGAAADFSVESAKIKDLESSIGAIIEPPVVPVEPPMVPPADPIVPPVVLPVV